jgi:hypothetical protein
MSGKRLISFRAGDRSEYLAAYALSRMAFVNPCPRQEDFGVADFLCVLTKEEGQLVFPESAFYVQTKSDTKDVIFDVDVLRWISEYMDHPLLFCIADKKTSRIKVYSCWPIWRVVFPHYGAKKVTIVFDGNLPLGPEEKVDNAGHFKLSIGPPILDKTLDEIESDPDFCHTVLKEWLERDAQNIARRRVGRIAIAGASKWETNKPLKQYAEIKTLYLTEGKIPPAEKALAPILTALAHNYRHTKQRAKLEALCRFLAEIEEHLDPHGKEFAQGKLLVDE